MLRRAVALYHELLADPELAAASRAVLDEGLERSKLIFGGRRLSPYLRPHFVTEQEFARATSICETIWGAIQKVKDVAVANPALQDELHLTPIEKELVAINPGYRAVSPNARLDSFLTESAYSFVELNGESPAGVAYADSAAEIFLQLPVMKRFQEHFTLRYNKGRHLMLDVLLRAHEEYLGRKPETPPQIGIIDLKGLPTQKEFELFKEYFESKGCPACIASPEDLRWDGEKLRAGDFAIDIVYKRLLVNEYLPIMDEYPALLNAYRAGAVCMVNSFQSKIIHKKALFVILTDPRHAHLFSEEELAAIQAHVPWTRHVRDEKTAYQGGEVNLLEHTRTKRDRLVLKPNDDYGGHGIYIGWNSTADEWEKAIQVALADGDYLAQERVPTAREVFPALLEDGSIEYAEQLVDLDPLLYFGKVGSAFTRLSFSELANVSSGGGMVPTFIISEKS
jgi:hypothetical protein